MLHVVDGIKRRIIAYPRLRWILLHHRYRTGFMRKFVDLHTHSTSSDGVFTPGQIVDEANRVSLAAVALCDHDTVAGIAEAAERAEHYPELIFVPGVEISALCPSVEGGSLHILGLGIDYESEGLLKLLHRLRRSREERNPKIVEALNGIGIDITMDDVIEVIPDSSEAESRVVSRVHIAEVLVKKRAAFDIADAFRKYLGGGCVCWIDRERAEAREAIETIRDAGGAAIVAHPSHMNCRNLAIFRRLVREWIGYGLKGIECYHPAHNTEQVRRYMDIARSLGLAITGGSDFHGRGRAVMGHPRVPLYVADAVV